MITESGTGLELGTFSLWAQVANHFAKWYVRGARQKNHLIATFLEQFKENPWIHVNLIKIKSIHFLIVKIAYVQGALLKKRLTASFVEHFIASFVEYLENSISIIFQFHVIKFNQKQYFSFYFGYAGLYAA